MPSRFIGREASLGQQGMSFSYTADFNDWIYRYIGELYNQEIDVVKKRIKANFAEVLKK